MTAERQIDLEKSTHVRFPGLVRLVMRTGARLAPRLASRGFADRFVTPARAPAPEREQAWAAGAERFTVRSGDYDLAVSCRGLGGPQILLVHGWSGRGSQLGAFIEPLVRAGYEVNWFDLPAHGRSSGRQSGLPDAVAAVEAVVAWLGGAHTVVAHSMGAAATTLAAARGAEIGRMVYLSPPDDVGAFLGIVGRLIGLPQGVIDGAQGVIERRFGVRFEELLSSRAAHALEQPLLAIHDRGDREVPLAEVRRVVAAWPHAELVLTEELGHRRILRDPAVVARVVEFATREPAAGVHHRAA